MPSTMTRERMPTKRAARRLRSRNKGVVKATASTVSAGFPVAVSGGLSVCMLTGKNIGSARVGSGASRPRAWKMAAHFAQLKAKRRERLRTNVFNCSCRRCTKYAMLIRCPELTTEQIAGWMQRASERPVSSKTIRGPVSEWRATPYHPGFDFKKTRDALNRARTKTDVRTIKPLQRLRRNQGAVNEGLVDAFSALISVNKQMAAEISALSTEITTLRQRLAEIEVRSTSEEEAGQL